MRALIYIHKRRSKMKKNIVYLLMLIPLFAMMFAADFSVKSQVRYRYEAVDKDFDSNTGYNVQNYLRSRIGVEFTSESVTSFMQLQDSRVMGSETNTLKDGSADIMDFHQAYFKINNLFDTPLNLKIGRFESIYGGQRLIGAVGWHNIGRSFDGLLFNYKNDIIDVDVFTHKLVAETDSTDEKDLLGVYSKFNLIENQNIHGYVFQDGDMNTFGSYLKGGFKNFGYDIELAFQNGIESENIEFAGKLLAVNLHYKHSFAKFSGGVDYVSGDDSKTTDKNESFSTLYATNHKFYGFMDYFLNLPENTSNLGLMDIHVKLSDFTLFGLKFNGAYHLFNADQSDESFGSELDLTVIKKYNKNVKFVAGYSVFTPGELKSSSNESATFTYLMTIINL